MGFDHIKTALITGASSGIGEACARLFAERSHGPLTLVITGRRADRLESLSRELTRNEINVVPLSLDVRNRHEVEELAKNPLLSRLDLLVNNAGLAAGQDPIQSGDPNDWEQMIDTNVKGLLWVTRALLPRLLARGTGHVVNIGSIAGRSVYPNGGVYCATKHAVRALNEAIRLDTVGSGVRVSSVDPGMVDTEFSLVRFKGDAKRARNVYEGVRPLTGRDVAEAVLWCVNRPDHVNVQEILLMPTDQAGPRDVYRRAP